MRYILEIVNAAIVVNYVCHIYCIFSLIETLHIACDPCLCTGLDPEVKSIVLFSDYPLVKKKQVLLSCAMRQ